MILNLVSCVPVLITVGAFRFVHYFASVDPTLAYEACSVYHFWGMFENCTTIEAREKDRATTLVRRGKLSEVYDYLQDMYNHSCSFIPDQIPIRKRPETCLNLPN
jgi:hypothetical protein